MTEPEIYAALNEIFRDLFFDDTIALKPETTAKDIKGWDSFNHVNVVIAAEQRFGIKLKTADIEGVKNVGDLVRTIQKYAA